MFTKPPIVPDGTTQFHTATETATMVTKKRNRWQPLALHPKKEETSAGFQQTRMAPTSSKGDPIFFWKVDGDNGWLCQWYRCTFTDPESEITFTCAEQWMVYHKAVDCRDMETAALILKTSFPRKQKGLGAKAANFDEKGWPEVRSGIVERGSWLKFTQDVSVASMEMNDKGQASKLRDMLLATGVRELVDEVMP